MCGIVACIGKGATKKTIQALTRVEYRGYDSAGIAVRNKYRIAFKKRVRFQQTSAIDILDQDIAGDLDFEGDMAIGHTRWATHGAATEDNGHPHVFLNKSGEVVLALVHNGMIENWRQLKDLLLANGHVFRSETDTEVVAHLIAEFLQEGLCNRDALLETLKVLKGTYAFAIIFADDPDTVFAARLGSPLAIGLGNENNFVASEPSALVENTSDVIYLKDRQVAEIHAFGKPTVTDIDNQPTDVEVVELDLDVEQAQKGDYPHFMLKEIYEGPRVLEDTCRGRLKAKEGIIRLGGLQQLDDLTPEEVLLLGCGTSYNAALIGEVYFQEIAGISTKVEYSSDFRYKKPPVKKNALAVAITQSGETADTIIALQVAKKFGYIPTANTNVVGSTITRETVAGVYNHAGPEIGVASTKAFLSQVTVLFLMAAHFAKEKPLALMEELELIPRKVESILSRADEIERMAKILVEKYRFCKGFSFVGHKYNLPIALEGALKLAEVTRINAKGSPAAEIKHWSIALIDELFPTVAIVPKNGAAAQMYQNIEQMKARGGPIIAIATDGDQEIRTYADHLFYVPKTLEPLEPLLTVVPLQLLAYYMAVEMGLDPDRPRNLAKSITVQ